jgi:xanthine dehydrogenase accessory factor
MSELRALAAAARQLRERQLPFVSATVVAVRGSGYRHAGARMIATQSEWLAGSISGGCLERDVAQKGFWYTRDRAACVITYDQAADALEEGGGTGCQGVVDVLIERHAPGQVAEADVFAAAERCIRDEHVAVVISVVRSTRADLPLGARAVLQAGQWYVAPEHAGLRALFDTDAARASTGRLGPHLVSTSGLCVLVECMLPPVHLYVFGSGHDATPLVTLAKQLGWSVSVWDASPRSSARERFAHADHYLTGSVTQAVERLSGCVRGAAVVMGHDLARDRAAVAALLASDTSYIGILGSRQRTELILAECRASGLQPPAAASRIYAPVGLALGAQTPAEIALAIVAEIQSVHAHSAQGL